MSFSVSTFFLFLALLPGLIFRFSVFQGSVVKRVFGGSDAIFSILTILLYAVLTHAILYLLIAEIAPLISATAAAWETDLYYSDRHGIMLTHSGLHEPTLDIKLYDFILNNVWLFIIYIGISALVALFLGWFLQFLSRRSLIVGRILYGPLANLLQTKRVPILTCFVLTAISHQNRRMVYAGLPREIGLREGSKIDYIVLDAPTKFYLRLNAPAPITSFPNARPITADANMEGLLFIAEAEIENVHFEGWYLEK